MVRTQIYLTDEERAALRVIAQADGRSQSELIRDAVDDLILRQGIIHKRKLLVRFAGMWKDRTDLPDFAGIRAGWTRAGAA
ncbi:MAG: ribbon-helix-helix domain-containing protein [Candidatus Aureabacteria bacterium]|nr:ribbon-helix-helix domain-containing protein [Candidatus Auribacterota bacterium]